MTKVHTTVIDLIKQSRFRQARRMITRELEQSPRDGYLLIQMANVLWNLNKDTEALAYLKSVDDSMGATAFALFTKGRVLMSLELFEESIAVWNLILQKSTDEIANDVFHFGVRWAKSLLADSLFYRAQSLFYLYRDQEALVSANDHFEKRQRGIPSDFTKVEVLQFIRQLKYSSQEGNSNTSMQLSAITPFQRRIINTYIGKYAKEKDSNRLIKYLIKKTKEYPKEYYFWMLLSEYHCSVRTKDLCLSYARKAYDIIGDKDMLVVYDYGMALYLNGFYKEAHEKFSLITDMDINRIAFSEHGEGMRWAKRLVRESRVMTNKCIRRCNGRGVEIST